MAMELWRWMYGLRKVLRTGSKQLMIVELSGGAWWFTVYAVFRKGGGGSVMKV